MNKLRFICSVALSLLLPSQTFPQSNGAAAAGLAAGAALGASSSQSSTTASSAGGSSSPIEMNIMAYGGIKQIATTMSNEIYAAIASNQPNNPASDHCATTRLVLLEDTTTMPLLSLNASWNALEDSLAAELTSLNAQITTASQQVVDIQAEVNKAISDSDTKRASEAAAQNNGKPIRKNALPNQSERQDLLGLVEKALTLNATTNTGTTTGTTAASSGGGSSSSTTPIGLTYLSDISSAITAAKSGLTYSSSTVSPATQSLTTALSNNLCKYHIGLLTSASTINLADASDKVTKKIIALQTLNATIQAALNLNTSLPTLTQDQKTDKALQALMDTDTAKIKAIATTITSVASTSSQLTTSFLSWQSGTDGNGGIVITDVIRAITLQDAIGTGIPALQFNIDAAGGNTRTNSYFLFNLIYTPKPSFNAGVVVTYELRGFKNEYIAGDTLKVLYDYSKWKPNCFKMNTADDVNTTSLPDGSGQNQRRTGHAFLCETTK
jgi:hypothetical protein